MKDDSRVNTPVRHCVYDSLHLFSLPLSLSPPIHSLSFNVLHRERERERERASFSSAGGYVTTTPLWHFALFCWMPRKWKGIHGRGGEDRERGLDSYLTWICIAGLILVTGSLVAYDTLSRVSKVNQDESKLEHQSVGGGGKGGGGAVVVVECTDVTPACATWAENNDCSANKAFMERNCCRSCSSSREESRRRDENERETFYVFEPARVGLECENPALRQCYHGEGWVLDKFERMSNWKRVWQWEEADFLWTFAREFRFDFSRVASKTVNHIEGLTRLLGDKSKLFHTLENYGRDAGCDVYQFVPRSFDTAEAMECSRLLEKLKAQKASLTHSSWLVKPSHGSGGEGIALFRSASELLDWLTGGDRTTGCQERRGVAQEYVSNPLLLESLKQRKFHLRVYVLVASTEPLVVYQNQDGYISASQLKFNSTDFNSRATHLTGLHEQEQLGANYNSEHRMYTLEEFSHMVSAEYPERFGTSDLFLRRLTESIKSIARYTVLSAQDINVKQSGSSFFNPLALDLLMNANFELFLLEVNCYPW